MVVLCQVNTEGAKKVSFPKLMQSKQDKMLVVCMTSWEEGTVFRSNGKKYSIGFYSDVWDMDCFEDFAGLLALSLENK